MFVFIWERIDKLTQQYHPAGGLVVVAPSLERAATLLKSHEAIEWGLHNGGDVIRGIDPDVIIPVDGDAEEEVFIFPDAGCC